MRMRLADLDGGAPEEWDGEMDAWDSDIDDVLEQAVVLRECGHRYRDSRKGISELEDTVDEMDIRVGVLKDRMKTFLDGNVEHREGYPWYVE